MSEHSKEPWSIGKINHKRQYVEIDSLHSNKLLGYDSWEGLAKVYGCNDDKESGRIAMEANARRIVACVNACAGVPTDALEALKGYVSLPSKRYRDALQQRDKFLTAIEGLLNALPSATTHPAIKAARAIVAEVEAAK